MAFSRYRTRSQPISRDQRPEWVIDCKRRNPIYYIVLFQSLDLLRKSVSSFDGVARRIG